MPKRGSPCRLFSSPSFTLALNRSNFCPSPFIRKFLLSGIPPTTQLKQSTKSNHPQNFQEPYYHPHRLWRSHLVWRARHPSHSLFILPHGRFIRHRCMGRHFHHPREVVSRCRRCGPHLWCRRSPLKQQSDGYDERGLLVDVCQLLGFGRLCSLYEETYQGDWIQRLGFNVLQQLAFYPCFVCLFSHHRRLGSCLFLSQFVRSFFFPHNLPPHFKLTSHLFLQPRRRPNFSSFRYRLFRRRRCLHLLLHRMVCPYLWRDDILPRRCSEQAARRGERHLVLWGPHEFRERERHLGWRREWDCLRSGQDESGKGGEGKAGERRG